MKSSELEVYVAAAYAGLTGIMRVINITIITFTGIFNWKSLVKAMQAFSWCVSSTAIFVNWAEDI